ncbi:Uncharacterised protein [Enterobacter cloacae]|nr:Uncharacterised protein [Enterobacter cloacae]
MLDNPVHLLFQLFVELRQAGAHVAALTYLFGNDLIQRNAAFLNAGQGAFVNPRQRSTQIGLVVSGLLTLRGGQVVLFAIERDITLRRDDQIAVLTFNLNGLRT